MFVGHCLIVKCVRGGITQVYVLSLRLDLPILVMRGALISLAKYHLVIHKQCCIS